MRICRQGIVLGAALLLSTMAGTAIVAQPAFAQRSQGTGIDDGAVRADMQRAIEQRRRQLLPEYERRVRADGRKSADDWLRAAAADAGRRDGAAVRRNHDPGRNRNAADNTAGMATAAKAARGEREDPQARQKRGDPACARIVTRQRNVPSMSGGAMQMIMVTECVPASR